MPGIALCLLRSDLVATLCMGLPRCDQTSPHVMAGLDPAIHVFTRGQGVDTRH
jgi:hypothetical protein